MAAFDLGTNWPNPREAPDDADLARCVHCGLCVTSCPTYLVTGLETESPRGRIALARGVADGLTPVTAAVETHWDRCLQCRACEVACPSAVPYGRIMESLRAQVAGSPRSAAGSRRVRRFLLRNLLGRRALLGLATAPLRFYANSRPGQLLSRRAVPPKPAVLRRLERQIVRDQGLAVRPGSALPQPDGKPAERVILFTGCIMGELFGEVHRATARILARRHIAVEAVAGQGCCGALSAHDGDLSYARELARRNIQALDGDERPILVNAAGCGAALKEYGRLLGEDSDWRERATAFSTRVRDLSEYIHALARPIGGSFPARVAYQDACHLAHVQRVVAAPRELLAALDGCRLVESAGDATCCGAAGLYGVVQPALSDQLRARKVAQFQETGPDVIITANPGCHMQFTAAVREGRIEARVMHIAQVLDEAEARID